jgi:hypothetical protein
MNPREVVELNSDPSNLLIHGLARTQEPVILLKLSNKRIMA